MKKSLLLLTLIATVTQADDHSAVLKSIDLRNSTAQMLGASEASMQNVLPTDEKPAIITRAMPKERMTAQIAAQTTLSYHKQKSDDIYYLNANYQPTDTPDPKGFYYKAVGITDDSRIVVQTFYQSSGKPFTSPIALVKDTTPDDINLILPNGHNIQPMDGRLVKYLPDGSIFQINDFNRGNLDSYIATYRDGQLISLHAPLLYHIAEKLPFANPCAGVPFNIHLYPNGKPMVINYIHANGTDIIYYRADGSPVAMMNSSGIRMWDSAGNLVDPATASAKKVEKEFDAIGDAIEKNVDYAQNAWQTP